MPINFLAPIIQLNILVSQSILEQEVSLVSRCTFVLHANSLHPNVSWTELGLQTTGALKR